MAPTLRLSLNAVVCVVALMWLTCANAQETHRYLPANAHYSAGEQGWSCNNDFRQVADLCVQDRDEVPSWGAFEVFDNGEWRCRSGYHREGSFCVPGVAPAHAAFVGGGDHWECEWGFHKVASRCEEITPPPHAYIDATGRDWVCYPGYERKSDHCDPVPATAPPAGDTAPAPSEEQKPDGGSPPPGNR